MWDYDPPAPPALVSIKKEGKVIDAVAQISKQGLYLSWTVKRANPCFLRPVPTSNLPGESASPTQPFPLKPKPFSRQSITEADLTNYSASGHDSIVKKLRSLRNDGLYTPPGSR
jgi:quinoprotein glucose dehydrogenase